MFVLEYHTHWHDVNVQRSCSRYRNPEGLRVRAPKYRPAVTHKQYQPPTWAAAHTQRTHTLHPRRQLPYPLSTQYSKLKTQNKHSDFPVTVAPSSAQHPPRATRAFYSPNSLAQTTPERPSNPPHQSPHPEPESESESEPDPDIMRLRAASRCAQSPRAVSK